MNSISRSSLLLLPLISAWTTVQAVRQGNNARPNIVFILADDLGYGDLSCLNENGKIHTLNIDRIAENGVVFTDAHSSSAVCTPTRYGILTGRYNWRSTLKEGVLEGYSKALISGERTTMPKMLKNQGYKVSKVEK